MAIQYTSRLGLASTIDNLKGLQLEVYNAIAKWQSTPGPTIEQLAAELGRKESSICGRINELRSDHCIADGPLTQNQSTGKMAKTYTALANYPIGYIRREDNSSGQLSLI